MHAEAGHKGMDCQGCKIVSTKKQPLDPVLAGGDISLRFPISCTQHHVLSMLTQGHYCVSKAKSNGVGSCFEEH